MVNAAHGEIQKVRDLLGQMPDQANRLIHFLNYRNREQLEQLGILDRTGTILDIKRVLTKKTLMQNLEKRCQDMQVEINSFMQRFTILQDKGLPSLLGNNDRLMRHTDYTHKLNTYAIDQVNSSTSDSGEKALPSGQSLYDNLDNLFYIEHEVKHLFQLQPNFVRYTEADETLRKL